MNNDLKTTQTVLLMRKLQRTFSISFPETARSRSRHATYDTQPRRPPPESRLVLDGGREAVSRRGHPRRRERRHLRGRCRGRGGEGRRTRMGGGSSKRQAAHARWVAMDRMPQYRRAKLERKEAHDAGAADAARCSTTARNKSTLSWLHRPPTSQAAATNLIRWAWLASSGYFRSLS